MKTDRISKLAVALACACLAASAARAITLDVGLTDSLAVGDVINGIQAGGQVNRDVIMVNNLLTVPLGGSSTTIAGDLGDLYQRSLNNFGPLPTAVAGGAQFASGIGDGSA